LLLPTENNKLTLAWRGPYEVVQKVGEVDYTRKPRKGAAVIAASMHGFASCRKFKSPVTLTLDRVKVIWTYAVYVGLPAYPTM